MQNIQINLTPPIKDMKKEEKKWPVEIYNEVSPSELADNKIWVDIKPVDDWNTWWYKIYFEDAMSPFFEVYSSGTDKTFVDYSSALRDAINWLEVNDYIVLVGLPF